jgi:uncharacterized membrane protein YdjX (TVP38/TMEM64 family)
MALIYGILGMLVASLCAFLLVKFMFEVIKRCLREAAAEDAKQIELDEDIG